ncbi:MAG TPA: hypothetical protein VN893_19400, partial [Bryobacteraceae bacterium]|nr:hypothetical protein [Bryobacteraceae bacterium]
MWSEPAWLRPLVVGLAALLLIGLFSTQADDSDLWWHLKTGQYILQHHALPSPDPFSYTSNSGAAAYPGEELTREFNLTHEWLAQVLLYALYAAGAFPAVILFRALLLAGICGITGFLAARRSGSFYAGVIAALAVAAVATSFTADRPPLLTFLLVAVFVLALELRRGLWVLPLLSLVWANLHGGFFLGWVVLAAYIAGSPRERRLWIVALLSVAASFLNPNHWRIVEVLQLYRQSALTRALVEWKPPQLFRPPYVFDILLFGTAVVLLLAWRKVRVSDWLLAAAFGAASMMAFRNILLFALLAPVLIATYLPGRLMAGLETRCRRGRLPHYAAVVLLAAAFGAGLAQGRFFQLRAAEWQYPSGAAQFLIDHGITAPLFNLYGDGGYLIWRLWPQERVFIDGRALNESVYQDYRRILYNRGGDPGAMTGPRAEALARYGVGAIVVDSFQYFDGRQVPLAAALLAASNAEWKLVYQDAEWMVFLRQPPAGMPG